MFSLSRLMNKTRFKGTTVRRYFGLQGAVLKGAVYCKSAPGQPLTVALLDADGKVLRSVVADGPCSRDELPPNCGFSIPVPMEWLAHPESEIQFSFRVLENGVEFPEGGRVIDKRQIGRIFSEEACIEESGGAERLEKALAEIPRGSTPFVIGIHEMQRSGAPLIALSVIRQLVKARGWHPLILCLGPTGPLTEHFAELGQVVFGMGPLLSREPGKMLELLRRLRQVCAPAALVNSISTTPLASSLSGAGFKVLSLIHEYPFAYSKTFVGNMMEASEEIIFPCEPVREAFSESLARFTVRSSVLSQGAYLVEERDAKGLPPIARQEMRERIGVGPEENIVLTCGTVDTRKGFDWFTSFVLHFGRYSPLAGRTHFVWLGKEHDKALFFHGQHSIEINGMGRHFHHLEEMDDPSSAYGAADLLLMCSRIDPFPSVVLEAMAFGLPVLGFDRGQGTSALIEETGYGAVVRSMDMEEARMAIERLLGDNALRKKVALEGPAFVRNRFRTADYAEAIASRLDSMGQALA